MIPRKWTPSDPITAERLNQSQAEASRARRDISLGNGSSMVNEQMGNQSANMRAPQVKLVVALEDFSIPETPTDIAGVVDDVPSGMVREVRLGRKSSTHQDDTSSVRFLAYDVVGGLDGAFCDTGSNSDSQSASSSGSASSSESGNQSGSKSQCDVFYVIYNVDSKRWEVLPSGGGGAPTIMFEIVRIVRGAGLNCNAMECEVLNVSCSASGIRPGQTVIVYDELGCSFNAPEHLLVGIRGYAKSMDNPSENDPLVFEPGTEDIAAPTGSCRWCVQKLCCIEEDS